MNPIALIYNFYAKAIEKKQIYSFSLKQKKMSFQVNQNNKWNQ